MRVKWRGLPKLVAIVGGFLIMIGIVLLGIAALAFSGSFDVSRLLTPKYVLTFALITAVVGLLDIFAAIIIARW